MNILVTAIGSMSSECVVMSLLQHGHRVFGTDIYESRFHPISKQCVDFAVVPKAGQDPDGYCDVLLKFALKNKCEAIVPLTDLEVDVLSRCRAAFECKGIRVWLPDDEVIRQVRNNDVWARLLKDCVSFKTIRTYRSFKALSKDYSGRFVAKRINGRSSEGIVFSNTAVFLEGKQDFSNYVFQPFIDGAIVTVDFACHPCSKQIVCVPRKELLRTGNGAGTVVEILNPNLVDEPIREICKTLGISGVMNCEFIQSKESLYLMDINPRFSAGISFSKKAGCDFIFRNFECYCHATISGVSDMPVGAVYVKRYSDFG